MTAHVLDIPATTNPRQGFESAQAIEDPEVRIRSAIGPHSFVEMADGLLDVMCDVPLRLEWMESGIRIRLFSGPIEISTPRPVLRTILARFSCLLNERNPTADHSPYSGCGILPANDGTGRAASIEYGNSQQTGVWLKSTPVSVPGT